MTINRI